MDPRVTLQPEAVPAKTPPVGYVPTPTALYREHRKSLQVLTGPGQPRLDPMPRSLAAGLPRGSRVLIWKQDPAVTELGIGKAFLPGVVLEGPRDARITYGLPGIAPVSPNAFGDFIAHPRPTSSMRCTPSPSCARP